MLNRGPILGCTCCYSPCRCGYNRRNRRFPHYPTNNYSCGYGCGCGYGFGPRYGYGYGYYGNYYSPYGY